MRVVFDLDGTLIDSAPDLARVANLMLAEYDRPPLSEATVRGFIGEGVPKLAERIAGAVGLPFSDAVVDRYRAIYRADPLVLTKPYPGVVEALAALRDGGATMAICTNKPEAPTVDILDRLGWSGFFDTVIGGDTLLVRKPDPQPLLQAINGAAMDRVTFVGDSEVDGATGAAAGVRFLLFTEGYRKGSIDAIPHPARFSDFAALGELIG